MSSWGGLEPLTGAQIRERYEKLNHRLAVLGIYSLSRFDKAPRLHLEDWEKLAALAEADAAAKIAEVTDPAVSPG